MAVRRLALTAAAIAGLAAGVWYLRDPAWLAGQTSGLRGWQRGADGGVYRWSGGHASFFVPADAKQIRIPISTTFDARQPRGNEPMQVAFTIDDRPARRVLLTDAGVYEAVLDLPPRGSRRVRRIDIRTSVTREDNHGVMVGPVSMTLDGGEWRPCCLMPR
jgi:hypothetical protein